jgi:oxygen-dependent protoporphyrinogen oxidase
VVVVGAGISGLSAAWELTGGAKGPDASTPRIEIIEALDRVGGALATTTFAGRVIDLGADGFLARRAEATTLAEELGLNDQLVPIDASGASLWLRGSLRELPTGLVLGVPTSAGSLRHFKGLSRRAHLQLRRDEFLARRLDVGDDATIGDIVRTKLGHEIAYHFVEPMIGGIQAGRIDNLSAKSVFPALLDAARKGGSLMKALGRSGPVNPGPTSAAHVGGPAFMTLRDGTGSLPHVLEQQLIARGVIIRKRVSVSALRRTPAGTYPWEVDTQNTTTPANAVIVTSPAQVAGRLLASHHPDLAALQSIDSAGAAMVTFSVTRNALTLPEHGTGVLVPLGTAWSRPDSLMVTALTFLDRKWPHLYRDHDVLLRAHVGRSDDARWQELNDEELTTRVTQELAHLLGMFPATSSTLVQRWPESLPQYRVGHEELVARARRCGASLGIALAGMAYDGVGIPASIGSGRRAAKDTAARL